MEAKIEGKTKLALCSILFLCGNGHAGIGLKEAIFVGGVSALSSLIMTEQIATSVKIGLGAGVFSYCLKHLFYKTPSDDLSPTTGNSQEPTEQEKLLEDLLKANHNLLSENKRLRDNLSERQQQQADQQIQHKQTVDFLNLQTETQQREIERLQNENKTLEKQTNALQTQNKNLQDQLKNLQDQLIEETSKVRETLEKLSSIIRSFQTKLKSLPNEAAGVKEVKSCIGSLAEWISCPRGVTIDQLEEKFSHNNNQTRRYNTNE